MDGTFEDWAEIFRTLGDKTRLHILSLLQQKEMCVCELTALLKMTQPGISQHLRKLKNAGLVKERKNAQWVYYSIDGGRITFLQEILNQLPDVSDEVTGLPDQGTVCAVE